MNADDPPIVPNPEVPGVPEEEPPEVNEGEDPVPLPPNLFALTPYQAQMGIISYHTSEGRKFYSKATSQLADEKFGCEADDLLAFLEDLARRSNEFGWNSDGVGIMEIPDDPLNENTTYTSLLENYGEFTLATIRAHELTYINSVSRAAQDTVLLYHCLMNSLSREGKSKVMLWKHDYMVGDVPSGNLLLKIIIQESCIDTNATTSTIRLRLSNLDKYLPTVGYDIAKFNQYVQQQVKSLSARGERTQDLLTNLFKGYLSAKDRVFCAYINSKKEKHEEGQNISTDQLMKWARNKFDIIKESGKWNAPSSEEQQIIALRAEIKSIKGNEKSKQSKSNKRNFKGTPKSNWEDKPEWFQGPPSQKDKDKPKTWINRQWYWCGAMTGGQCETWRQHKPQDCGNFTPRNPRSRNKSQSTHQGKESTPAPGNKKVKFEKQGSKNSQDSDRKLKLQKALSAVVESKDDDSSSS